MRRVLRTALVAWSLALPARADILVWRDAGGVSHYTNDLANVPEEFRGDATTVAKDWARAEPSAPEEPAVVSARAPTAADEEATARPGEVFEAGYAAGLRASGDREPGPVTNVGPMIQSVEVAGNEDRRDHLLSGPVIVERRSGFGARHAPHARDRDRRRLANPLPPARHAPYLQGPAGPPPVNFED